MEDLFNHVPEAAARGWPPVDQDNYYFCAIPPPEVAQTMQEHWWQVATTLPGRYPFRYNALHLSLLGIERSRGPVARSLQQVITAAAAVKHPKLNLVFDRIETLGQKASGLAAIAISATAQPHDDLAANIYTTLRLAGVSLNAPKKGTAHVTMAYAPTVDRRFLTVPLSWQVESFALVKSVKREARLEILDQWPLGT